MIGMILGTLLALQPVVTVASDLYFVSSGHRHYIDLQRPPFAVTRRVDGTITNYAIFSENHTDTPVAFVTFIPATGRVAAGIVDIAQPPIINGARHYRDLSVETS